MVADSPCSAAIDGAANLSFPMIAFCLLPSAYWHVGEPSNLDLEREKEREREPSSSRNEIVSHCLTMLDGREREKERERNELHQLTITITTASADDEFGWSAIHDREKGRML
jgi:hypothetical protein